MKEELTPSTESFATILSSEREFCFFKLRSREAVFLNLIFVRDFLLCIEKNGQENYKFLRCRYH